MITLLSCDVAGTTVDEGNLVYRVLHDVVTEFGAEVSEEVLQEWTGIEKRWAIRNLLELGGSDASDERVDAAFDRFAALLATTYRENPPAPIAGVEDFFRRVRSTGVKVALTTGFTTPVTESLLAGLGWAVGDGDPAATVDAVVCADTVAEGRPAPYLIHRSMELTGTHDVAAVVAIGDTGADMRAAVNAGVTAVGVLTGALGREGFAGIPVELVLESICDLPDELLAAPAPAPVPATA